jgi:uncharacterized repeat protein (TIGR01451 family)
VTAATADPNPDDDIASAVTAVLPPTADLVLTLVGPSDPVLLGNNLAYAITISNRGPATATGVVALDTLPPTLNFVSAVPTGYTVAGRVVTFTNLGNLGSGAQANLTITVRPTVAGTFTNTATCSSPAITDPRKADNSASVKTIVQLVPLTVSHVGASLGISWPTNGGNYILESTTNLSPPAVWTPVTDAVLSLVGGQTRVIVPIGPGNRYFRLRWTTVPVLTLSLSRTGNNVTIAWPVNPWNASLQSAADLRAPVVWTPATNPPPTVVGDQNKVTLPIGSASKFFRLQGTAP